MPRIRLTDPAYTTYTGSLGKVVFTNGVSANVSWLMADALGDFYPANAVEADGTTVIRQAGSAYRPVTTTTRLEPERNYLASAQQPLFPDPLPIKSITDTAYTVTDGDAGYLLDFMSATAVVVTVPAGLDEDFYCTLRQGAAGQVTVQAGAGAIVEEIDNKLKTEKRLALLSLVRFPDGKFQLSGRTAA